MVQLSCSPALYKPTQADGDEFESLNAGRSLYINRCSSCHNLYLPSRFTTEEWKRNLDEMSVKASLSNDEKEKILKYLEHDAKRR